ncbi:DNA mismatch repair protein MutS [bacterium]|nr:DNA mismatch repair protein MutS [bacterium]MDY3021268.1 DNA mismatch repair protein MutS [Oliverpabstia sp.]
MNIEKQIEFDKIKELWKNLCVTDKAKEQIDKISFYLSERELRKQLKDTTDSRTMLEKLGMPPLPNVEEIKEILMAAEKGDCLTPFQLERVEKMLAAVRRLRDYLKRGKIYENAIAYYDENLDAAEDLREEISRQIRGGEVDDYASKELFQIRNQIVKCEEQMKQKAEQILRSHKEYMADNYCTLRNGRLCLPVKKEYKLRINGSVIDKSATGNTLFMEPVSISRYYEEIQLLKISEENEVYRILYTLTAMTADRSEVLRNNINMIEKLDFIFSKGKLSMDLDGVEPSINLERKIILKNARHPLMDRAINVPLQFSIGTGVSGIVITGPNTGGKTVAIKTVMLNCMMAQCGLHVTCENADICMNSSYLCDIGDGQNLAENLSTFSSHIKNVLEILQNADRDSFVIMDELGSGTDPAEGMGIAIAILEELKRTGCLFLVTTHYPEVKEYAKHTESIVNARMTFDQETLQPTYQMIIGEAGESCAFYIADRLGMPKEMLQTAVRYAYGESAVSKYQFRNEKNNLEHHRSNKIRKTVKNKKDIKLQEKFRRGDSVMVFPDKKIGIVCETMNDKGVLRVQMPDKKIWINHKRVRLQVAASELYPEDYDFSIIFDTVENRKKRHDMERKYTEEQIEYSE